MRIAAVLQMRVLQVGTHFGGSIFAMSDPFYMLMYMNILGKRHLVWDHSACIR